MSQTFLAKFLIFRERKRKRCKIVREKKICENCYFLFNILKILKYFVKILFQIQYITISIHNLKIIIFFTCIFQEYHFFPLVKPEMRAIHIHLFSNYHIFIFICCVTYIRMRLLYSILYSILNILQTVQYTEYSILQTVQYTEYSILNIVY